MKNYHFISAKELHNLDQESDIIIDVRNKDEHNEKHLKVDHFHIPLDLLNPEAFIKKYNLNENSHNIHFLCGGGTRAKKAADKFYEAGYQNLTIIDGGLRSCEALGYDLQVKNTKIPQDERPKNKAKIILGSLVLVSTILAMLLHPAFLALSIIVAFDLIFSGFGHKSHLLFWDKNE